MKKRVTMILCTVFLFASVVTSCNTSEITMNISVTFYNQEFWFHNHDIYRWVDVEVYLNYEDEDISTGYTYKLGTIYVTEHVHGLRFMNSEGRSFNPWLQEPKIMMVRGKRVTGDPNEDKIGVYIKKW
jgi:hypothetical protein